MSQRTLYLSLAVFVAVFPSVARAQAAAEAGLANSVSSSVGVKASTSMGNAINKANSNLANQVSNSTQQKPQQKPAAGRYVMNLANVSSKWHCGKLSAAHSIPVGDVAGHSFGIAQGKCEASASSAGEKTGTFTESQELWPNSFTTRGQFNTALANDDTIVYSYEAAGDVAKKSVFEKWKIVGGTGAHKDKKGSGTCTGTLNDDGTSDWSCSGTVVN